MSSNSISTQSAENDYGFDLVASASAGPWRVLIDETHSGPEKWFVQLHGPSVYFSFEISSPKTIDTLVHFLEQSAESNPSSSRNKSNSSLLVSTPSEVPVTVIRDDEYADRCFLVLGAEAGVIVRYTFAGVDLANLTEALRKTKNELKSEGLLS
jgi:hypothetical protein